MNTDDDGYPEPGSDSNASGAMGLTALVYIAFMVWAGVGGHVWPAVASLALLTCVLSVAIYTAGRVGGES